MRRLRPDIAFGADIIAGFPTETEEMFARSLDLVDECGLTFLHVFPYSAAPRHAGCAHAAGRRRDAIRERARQLREKGEAALRERLAAEVGRMRDVLIESDDAGADGAFPAGGDCGPCSRHQCSA